MSDDYEIDPIWENEGERKKRKNSGRKGKRGELELTKILTERFKLPFSRVPQSGNRMAQVFLPEHVKEAYVGDIVTPPNFRFCLEVKHGYDEIDFNLIVAKNQGLKLIDEMLEQATRDATRINREPILCWKPDRVPWMIFQKWWRPSESFYLVYGQWYVQSLESFLSHDNNFFFT